MNVSLLWLRDFLKTDVPAARARELLTARAATVEAMTPVRADLGDIVVGRVATVVRDPEADHLWLTEVDAGSGELLEVVCGAANVRVGASYPFAPVGATLPGGVKIERRKIRGHLSNGMLCSAQELGLGTDREGILTLDTDAKPGTRFLDAGVASDVRLTLDVLPNRPDLLSHEGVARELAAAAGVSLRDWSAPAAAGLAKPRAAKGRRAAASSTKGNTGGVSVRIEDAHACPRYLATVVRGVKVGPSPRWLAERLEGAGVRSINNVVDVTNFMLHGFGQPMHAFDLAKLGGEVTVRYARQGERLVTLDGVERTLDPSMLVIAGSEGAQAIAGVIGGKGSQVGDVTTDILLEAAVFDPHTVRAARRALGIATDASYRFERHVDISRVAERAALAARLLATVAGGKATTPPADLYPSRATPRHVSLRLARAAAVLGEEIRPLRATALLGSVGFEARAQKSGALRVGVPSWRSDVVAEADLIEELARLHGYDNFPSELRPYRPNTVPDDPLVAIARRVRQLLVGLGLFETRPMPFVGEGADERLRIRNPLAENEAYLRGSIAATLAKRAEYNLALMQRSVRLFEIGTVFAAGDGSRPLERTHVGLVLMGDREPPHFTIPAPPPFDIWDAKWFAQRVAATAFTDSDIKLFAKDEVGASSGEFQTRTRIDANRVLWWVEADGEIRGCVTQLDLDAPAWAAAAYAIELDLTHAAGQRRAAAKFRPLPGTPAVEIDLALIVPDIVSAEAVENAVRRTAGELLESLTLFDEFRGAGIDTGARSLAWRLTFRHRDRTLRDKEVEGRRQNIVRALEAELGVRPRTS